MSKYAQVLHNAVSSYQADYGKGKKIEYPETTFTPDEDIATTFTIPTSARTVVPASAFTTIYYLYVRNLDTTNYVSLGFNNANGAVIVKLYGADNRRVFSTCDVAVGTAITLTANTASCQVEFYLLAT